MDREKHFWNKRADKYSKRPVADQAAYEKKLEVTRRYFQPDMEVLEIDYEWQPKKNAAAFIICRKQ
jgi:hypothetical protein